MTRLALVTAAPGRSGADALTAALLHHPKVAPPAGWTPALLGASFSLAIHAASDAPSYLPRRAAQALTDVVARLEELGEPGVQAASRLVRACGATTVTIPVYGELLLPAERSRHWWLTAVRSALVDSVPPEAQLAVIKSGPVNPPAMAALLCDSDSHLFVVRHPASLAMGLLASVVDGMRPAEAVDLVDAALRQAKELHAKLDRQTLTVRLEALCSEPEVALGTLADFLRLDAASPGGAAWLTAAKAGLPADVGPPPVCDQTALAPHAHQLDELAKDWGYA